MAGTVAASADTADRSAGVIDQSDDEEAVARAYLDRRSPDPDPVFELPKVERRPLHQEPPALQPEGTRTCDAVGRMAEDAPGTVFLPNVADRRQVGCRLSRGHGGPHIAETRWEMPRTRSICTWDP